MIPAQKKRSWTRLALVPVLVLLGIGAFIAAMPRGYSVNLTTIGQGLPAVVQVYDDNSVRSHELMEAFNKIRDDFDGRVEFLLADLSLPAGQRFAQQYNAQAMTIVFFAADGTVLHTLSAPQKPAQLRDAIVQVFALM